MKPIQLIVFLSIVIGVYSAANYFIYSRGMAALPPGSPVRNWFPWVFLFLSSSYIVARFLERIWISPVSDAFTWIGSYWLGIMIYLLLSLLLIDILRLIHLIAPIYPKFLTTDPVAGRYLMFKIVLAISIITVIAGSINALNPRTRILDVKIGKKAGSRKQLNIVMASDIHMGTLVGPRRTERMVEKINALKPDIILFAGDLVDEDPSGAAQPQLPIKTLINFNFFIPKSLEEQSKIVFSLREISMETQRLETIYRQKLAALNELKQSILQKAFTGQLTSKKG